MAYLDETLTKFIQRESASLKATDLCFTHQLRKIRAAIDCALYVQDDAHDFDRRLTYLRDVGDATHPAWGEAIRLWNAGEHLAAERSFLESAGRAS